MLINLWMLCLTSSSRSPTTRRPSPLIYPRVLSLASLRRPPYRPLSAAVSSSAPTNAPPPTRRPPTPWLPPAAPPFSSATPPRYPPSSHIHLTTRRHRQVTLQHPPVLLTFPLLIASPTACLHADPHQQHADCPPKAQPPPAQQPPSPDHRSRASLLSLAGLLDTQNRCTSLRTSYLVHSQPSHHPLPAATRALWD